MLFNRNTTNKNIVFRREISSAILKNGVQSLKKAF